MAPGHTGFGMGSEPVRPHWFYLRPEERYWFPFSLSDSARLEEALLSQGQGANNEVMVMMKSYGVKRHGGGVR